jgi:hypothetical protein
VGFDEDVRRRGFKVPEEGDLQTSVGLGSCESEETAKLLETASLKDRRIVDY